MISEYISQSKASILVPTYNLSASKSSETDLLLDLVSKYADLLYLSLTGHRMTHAHELEIQFRALDAAMDKLLHYNMNCRVSGLGNVF